MALLPYEFHCEGLVSVAEGTLSMVGRLRSTTPEHLSSLPSRVPLLHVVPSSPVQAFGSPPGAAKLSNPKSQL